MRRVLVILLVTTPLLGCGYYHQQQLRQAKADWPREARTELSHRCQSRGQNLPADYLAWPPPPDAPGRSFHLTVELETVFDNPRPCGLSRTERTRVVNAAFKRQVSPLLASDQRELTVWLYAVDLYLADLFDEGKLRTAQAEFLAMEARRIGYGELKDRRLRGAAVRAQQSQADAVWGRVFQEQWRLMQPQQPIPVRIIPGPFLPPQ